MAEGRGFEVRIRVGIWDLRKELEKYPDQLQGASLTAVASSNILRTVENILVVDVCAFNQRLSKPFPPYNCLPSHAYLSRVESPFPSSIKYIGFSSFLDTGRR